MQGPWSPAEKKRMKIEYRKARRKEQKEWLREREKREAQHRFFEDVKSGSYEERRWREFYEEEFKRREGNEESSEATQSSVNSRD